MKKDHQHAQAALWKAANCLLEAIHTHTHICPPEPWRRRAYLSTKVKNKASSLFLDWTTIRPITFTFLLINVCFLQSGFCQGQLSSACEESGYFFTGVPETTLCEEYGNLTPDLEAGAGTSITHSSQIGSNFTGNVFIMGDFYIDESFKFINCVVKVEPGATIFVLSPTQPFVSNILAIDNSKLFACNDMWNGIVLSSNTSISTNNETEIEDALAAIQADNVQYSSLLIEKTTFNRNDIGIHLSQDLSIPSPATIIHFTGNTFSCAAPLNGTTDQVGFAGIKTVNVPITVNPVAEAFNNLFEGLQNGIVAEGGNTTISGRFFRFERIKKDGIHLEEGSLNLVNSRFLNCEEKGINIDLAHRITVRQGNFSVDRSIPESSQYRTGIYIDRFGLNSRVDLNMTFTAYLPETENRVRGIHLKGGNIGSGTLIAIHDSYFSFRAQSSDGIFLDGAFPRSSKTHIYENNFATGTLEGTGISRGILMDGFKSNVNISGNYFTGNGFSNIAIAATGSSGVNNFISNNYIEGTRYIITSGEYFSSGFFLINFQNTTICSNINFFGSSFAFRIWATSPGTDFEGNLIYATGVGLELYGAPLIGPQFHQGNIWRPVVVQGPSGPTTFRALAHARCDGCDAQQAALNKFTIHTPQSIWNSNTASYDFFSDYHPEHIVPDLTNEFFEYDPAGTPSVSCIPFVSDPEISELDKIVADGLFQAPAENPAMGWLVDRYLYRKLKDNPDLVEEYASFPSFLSLHQTTSVGQFYEASHKVEEAIQAEENLDLVSQEVLKGLGWVTDSLMSVDSLLQVTEDENELEALIQSKFSLSNQLLQIQGTYDSLYAIYKEQLLSGLEEAYYINEDIETEEQYEANEKAVTSIYLLSMLEGEGELTEAQILELEPIAQQCPEEGGLAVYDALTLLPDCKKKALEVCEVEFVDEIEPLVSFAGQGESLMPPSADRKVYLYPNPAGLSFFLNLPAESVGEIIMAGSNGKTAYSQSSLEVNTRVEIRPSLPPGLYFVKIPLNDGSVLTEKLIIQTK